MSFKHITPDNVETKIKLTGTITTINQPEPLIETAVFKCKSCMRTYEVQQKTTIVYEPEICKECGANNFKLIPLESIYTEKQELTITSRDGRNEEIKIILYGNNCSKTYNLYDTVIITGILHVKLDTPNYYYIQVMEIQ